MRLSLLSIVSLIFFSFCQINSGNQGYSSVEKPKEDTIGKVNIENNNLIDTLWLGINFKPGVNYEEEKRNVLSLRVKSKNFSDSARKTNLEDCILNKLIPYWYKTPWEFSGYTNTPQKGEIACGYFVSTLLKHAGFNLNRYKLAQQDPMNEAKTIAGEDTVAVYETDSKQLQKIFNEKYEEGLYFAGLDFHVGFLLYGNNELYFIHSNYINAEGVIFEKAVFSEAFNASQTYRIAPLSTSKSLLEKWVNNEELKVITGKY